MRRIAAIATVLLAAGAAGAEPVEWQGRRAAFFGITFLDTSLEGELTGARDDEAARVDAAAAQIASAFAAQGVDLVDLAPVAEELERTKNPSDCNDCDLRMAQRLGADLVVLSEVQKTSNLILSMNVVVRDATTGATLRALAVDIRGNTDESWSRGIRYILQNGVFTG